MKGLIIYRQIDSYRSFAPKKLSLFDVNGGLKYPTIILELGLKSLERPIWFGSRDDRDLDPNDRPEVTAKVRKINVKLEKKSSNKFEKVYTIH